MSSVFQVLNGSSGSGACVAAGLSLAALGSDTGGSIRLPAAVCGITGYKPTYGSVSTQGAAPLSWSLDTAGPITRTVADCAHAFDLIAGHDPLDTGSAPVRPGSAVAEIGQDIRGRGKRIEEQIAVLRRLWSEPYVTFEGRYHTLDKVGLNRVAIPPIPIWMGGSFDSHDRRPGEHGGLASLLRRLETGPCGRRAMHDARRHFDGWW